MPVRPRRVAVIPSFMEPPLDRCISSSCTETGRSNESAYSSASRITPAFMTGLPSSVTVTASQWYGSRLG